MKKAIGCEDNRNEEKGAGRSLPERINAQGETEYGAPFELRNRAELEMYRVTPEDVLDYRVITYHGTDYIPVYMLWTPKRDLAEYCWSSIDRTHWEKKRNKRCLIPGKQKDWILCPGTNSCRNCPFGKTPSDKSPMFISLDESLDAEILAAPEGSAEDQAIRRMTLKEALKKMKQRDERIWPAFRGLYLEGEPAEEIAKEMRISAARVYQLVAKGKQILREAMEEVG